MFYDAGLGPNMVLVNAATGAPISATAAANSLSGTMTTQSNNSASLPAGISVQQLLQQAQQQQAAQSQQVQQQVHPNYILNHLTLGWFLVSTSALYLTTTVYFRLPFPILVEI